MHTTEINYETYWHILVKAITIALSIDLAECLALILQFIKNHMPRDYAKNNSNRDRDSSGSKGMSSWVWLLMGIVLGLVMAYAITHQSQLASFAKSSESSFSKKEKSKEDKQSMTAKSKSRHDNLAIGAEQESESDQGSTVKSAAKKSSQEQSASSQIDQSDLAASSDTKKPATPKFDFYTLLPKSQVASSEIKENESEATQSVSQKVIAKKSETKPSPASVSTQKSGTQKTPAAQNSVETAATGSNEKDEINAITQAQSEKEAATSVVPAESNDSQDESQTTTKSADAPISKESSVKSVAKATTSPVSAVKKATSISDTGTTVSHERLATAKSSATSNSNQGPSYSLQIASFPSYGEADRLKAELILLGFEPSIKSVKKNGATWNRVWLGPYHNYTVVQSVQRQLRDKHIKSNLVKETS